MTKDEEIATLISCLESAHELLSTVVIASGGAEQKRVVGVHGDESGVTMLSASFVEKCRDWCEGEFTPHGGCAWER